MVVQWLAVFGIVSGAIGYLGWRMWKALHGGCQGCGTRKPSSAAETSVFIPESQLTLRQRQPEQM
jgi:hypothetical protein